ncbi:MAG: carboxylating nicotinate-nucleotide diphosphorylase [Bacteroidetes bacterium]|nr:carboxylating nicotinate-nucleotide diphosphorylase [Bacteroidota bacterium]HET6244024.1 carboxylating nicotinate-nucleotide diphosphorylase [Bacteroidia bacterium]
MEHFSITDFIKRAFEEDSGDGDHTSLACIPFEATGKANLIVKEEGILAGMELAEQIFFYADQNIQFIPYIKDGSIIKPGDIAFLVIGKTQAILKAERIALNCLQRMSGIATQTRNIVNKLEGLNTRVLDTRKTTPGMRYFEKLSVKAGGGENHRFGLYDMIMIKDNHIDYAGGIKQAIDLTHNYLKRTGKNLKIEIETRNLNELQQVLNQGGIDRIMLDNFSPLDLKKAIAMINKEYETEASGGITEETIRDYALSGVDYISIGALTHHIKSLDLSLKAIK